MRVLVCGGRDYKDKRRVFEELDQISEWYGPITSIVEGGASGADQLGFSWAQAKQIPVITHFANWAKLGKGAGPIRNKEMLDAWDPDFVVAFPGGRGTANMVDLAKKAEIEVKDFG